MPYFINAFVKSIKTPINSSPLSKPLYSKLQLDINWFMVLSYWMKPDCFFTKDAMVF